MYDMFRPAQASFKYEKLYKNTKVDLHDAVKNGFVNFVFDWIKT